MNILRTAKGYSKLSLILLAYVAFIALGMPDGLLGVLARQFSLEVIPMGQVVFLGLFGFYRLSMKTRQIQLENIL